MQPSLPPVVLALLLVTLVTCAHLPTSISLTLVARNLRTLELLLPGDTIHQEEVRQKRGPRCVLHCLALGRLHPAQCHQLC